MRYLPHTDEDVATMLEAVGAGELEDLFAVVPADCLRDEELRLPEPLTEWELRTHVGALADTMGVAPRWLVFVGAGS
ncbi:MAG: glycine dehydrogenase, partial [Deltaproteobacteria bacterium]|nr:glycine dehydrogenase [Deltaproteobacteria bacterium]